MAVPAGVVLSRSAAPARGRAVVVGAVVAAAASVVAGAELLGRRPAPAAPTFSLEEVRRTGAAVTLPPPGRPAVVNFFASWCVPCRDELPVLEEAHRRHGASVAFVGIDVADSRTAATDLLDETGVTFAAGYDPHRQVAERYRLRGMPTTVFVDAEGRVAEVARGRLTAEDLDRRLERLLGEERVGTVRRDEKG